MTTSRGLVCVFAKVPRLGHVKTRLARTVGETLALLLAEAFLEDTLASLGAYRDSVVLALDGDASDRWGKACAEIWAQGEGSLGDRLERVLGRALEQREWAIALGTDSPGLPPVHLAAAMRALEREGGPRAVLGPCADGGYYLLGTRAMASGVLAGVRFGTPHALEDTERALERVGLAASRLEPWFDVDEERDLRELEGLLDRGAIEAPATRRVLRGH